MTNAEIAQARYWRMQMVGYLKTKILNTKDRDAVIKAIEAIKMPLSLALGGVTTDELKEKFINKVVHAVASAVGSDKYEHLIRK